MFPTRRKLPIQGVSTFPYYNLDIIMKLMYISGSTIALDVKDLIRHLGNSEIEVQAIVPDFYIAGCNFKVLESKDPRIKRLTRTEKLLTVDYKKQKRSYTLCSYNENTNLFICKYYHLDNLRYEVHFDHDDNIVSFINYHYPKKGNQNFLRTDIESHDECITIKTVYPFHKTNEYYSTKLYLTQNTIVMENRTNFKNDWYTLDKCTYNEVQNINSRIPKFDFVKLQSGQLCI